LKLPFSPPNTLKSMEVDASITNTTFAFGEHSGVVVVSVLVVTVRVV
jgi:hypothetical protein